MLVSRVLDTITTKHLCRQSPRLLRELKQGDQVHAGGEEDLRVGLQRGRTAELATGCVFVHQSCLFMTTFLQVFCNGAMATELALLYLLDVGSADLPIDFRHQ